MSFNYQAPLPRCLRPFVYTPRKVRDQIGHEGFIARTYIGRRETLGFLLTASLFRVEATFSSAAIANDRVNQGVSPEIYLGNHGDPLHVQVSVTVRLN